jgi:hypothetical protein
MEVKTLMIRELHVSKNLIPEIVQGGVSTGDGSFSNNTARVRTNYISVESGKTYSANSGNLYLATGCYYLDDTFIGKVNEIDVRQTATFTVPDNVNQIAIGFRTVEGTTNITPSDIENYILCEGTTTEPYEPYGDTWNTKSYAKIVDTTQQVTSFPVVVRPMENTIPSWTIKGNLSQSGTPTPTTPITPQECGERTENLFDKNQSSTVGYVREDGTISSNTNYRTSDYIQLLPNTQYTVSNMNVNGLYPAVCFYTDNKTYISGIKYDGATMLTFTTPSNCKYVLVSYFLSLVDSIMLNTGSTALPYQPYGYVLPIKSGNTTTPVYLGQVQSTRRIKKYVITGQESEWNYDSTYTRFTLRIPNAYFTANRSDETPCSHYVSIHDGRPVGDVPDKSIYTTAGGGAVYINIIDLTYNSLSDFKTYLAQQYANGTPVTIWYVLATETIGIVNEPIRKIGNYADSVSGTNLSVTAQSPTTIDVDTTLKPSEMDLTYTGTKMCKRKRKSRNLFDGTIVQGTISIDGNESPSTSRVRCYVHIEGGKQYTFKSTKYVRVIYAYNNDEKVGIIEDNGGIQPQQTTFEIPENANKIGIALCNLGGTGTITPSDVSDIMLNTGSTPLPYEPYWK